MGKRGSGWLLLGVLTAAAGCNHEDADRLARVSRKAAAKVQGLTGDAPGRLAETCQVLRSGWDEVALDARVTARLRWDKGLSGAHVEVRASGGTVELVGTVASDNQRGRAVELAQATVGVEQVTDRLTVEGEP
jgi:osmotically-inducible protein OsmY